MDKKFERKAKTRIGKKIKELRLPQVVEKERSVVVLRGNKTSEKVQTFFKIIVN